MSLLSHAQDEFNHVSQFLAERGEFFVSDQVVIAPSILSNWAGRSRGILVLLRAIERQLEM
jgi:hypothetical protein